MDLSEIFPIFGQPQKAQVLGLLGFGLAPAGHYCLDIYLHIWH